MKRIIFRSKETGKIVCDGDYEDYLVKEVCGE